MRPLADLLRALLAIPGAFARLLRQLLRLLLALFRPRPHPPDRQDKAAASRCVPIDDPAMRVPDPLVYSQQDLMARGLPVTWQNPDFTILDGGTPVGSYDLQPDHIYTVDVRVSNAAPDCPVVAMPVHLSYLDFGMGTVSVPVATRLVDVGVQGGPGNPSHVAFSWHTPAAPGHYCLQALLDPASDRNRNNNLGQHNTDVVQAHSPAVVSFTLRNETKREHRYRFETDAYVLQTPRCEDLEEYRKDLARHLVATPLPAGWAVELAPDQPVLAPGGLVSVTATVTPPAGFDGTQRINIHALYTEGYQDVLAGGVSVDVVKQP
ncbi:hypothetical protein ATL31_2838 [Phycicoccus duodecadis]|uniref:Alpha-galactosidase NEW3 domain-containing protein n=1 Tax=Phycicoccus duodecadis TaxID=173053 RepID=A0A2N3YM97_9MICO|nr:hypothetical protein ATL31_2838 [Phycicoccus duodecadis]